MNNNQRFHTVEGQILDFYIPSGSVITEFYLISPCESNIKVPSATAINISQGKRFEDNKWVLHFELKNPTYVRYFNKFCKDLFESTLSISDKSKGPDMVLMAFNNWKKMFTTENINKEDIQGAIGELLFLKEFMIPTYGEIDAFKAWSKSKYGKQDFNIDDTWYEVKSSKAGAREVTITSLDQLNNPNTGHLAVVKLQESTPASNTAVNLNSLYNSIYENLNEPFAKSAFEDAMLPYNIPDKRYDEFAFEHIETDLYLISEEFPKLLPSNVPSGINVPSYSIDLAKIKEFKEM
jgi:hypothetical protein